MILFSKLEQIPKISLGSMGRLGQELEFLSSEVASSTSEVIKDRYLLLLVDLARLHLALLEAHSAFVDPASIQACATLVDHLTSNTPLKAPIPVISMRAKTPSVPAQLRTVVTTNLNPSLQFLCASVKSFENQHSNVARAFVAFFVGCILLYVPDRPFDPAKKPLLEAERWTKRNSELKAKLFALRQLEESSSGKSTNLRCQLVERDLQALGSMPDIIQVLRPATSGLGKLESDFATILNTIARCTPNTGWAPNINTSDVIHEAELIESNIQQAVANLAQSDRMYDDITKPLVGFLQGLDVGVGLSLLALQTTGSPSLRIQGLKPLLGVCPEELVLLGRRDELWKEMLTLPKLQILFLERICLEKEVTTEIPESASSEIMQVFQAEYRNWKKRLERDQDQHATRSSLYRFQGDEAQSDAKDAEEFSELFPDYSGEDGGRGITDKRPQETATAIATLHERMFHQTRGPEQPLLRFIQDVHGGIFQKDAGLSNNTKFFPISPEAMLSSVTLVLGSTVEKMRHDEQNKPYNFYLDSNLSEAKRLVKLASRIRERFSDLKRTWPEHATLQDVLQTAEELLALHHTEPLAKLLTRVEKLHGYVYEWQLVASREFNVASLENETKEMIIGWRRLELATWARLLDFEREKCLEDVKLWWFVAYESIIAAIWAFKENKNMVRSYMEPLIAELRSFLVSTSLGQYSARLNLISTFSKYSEYLSHQYPAMAILHQALESLLYFHRKYEPNVHQTLDKGREPLEKEMKDIVLMASWRDTNIIALRDSAKRSHHKLFKMVRKYRALLAQPVEDALKQATAQDSAATEGQRAIASTSGTQLLDRRVLEICKKSFPGWDTKPLRFRDPEMTASKIARLNAVPQVEENQVEYLESFAVELLDMIKALQKETPATLNKDNRDTVKHLKSRKRKLFADTYREIRSMGFKPSLDAETLGRQLELHQILTNVPVDARISGTGDPFFDLVENMPAVRLASREHSDDLTNNEVNRAANLLESVFNAVISQRKFLVGYLKEIDRFDALLEKISSLWKPEQYIIEINSASHADVDTLKRRLSWIITIIDSSSGASEKHERLGGSDSSKLREILKEWRNATNALLKDTQGLPPLPKGISTSAHTRLAERVASALKELSTEASKWETVFPAVSFMTKHLQPWLEPLKNQESLDWLPFYVDALNLSEKNNVSGHHGSLREHDDPPKVALADIQSGLFSMIDSLLVQTQRMREFFGGLPGSTDDAKWLQRTDSTLLKIMQSSQISNITETIETVLFDSIKQLRGDELLACSALSAAIWPILSQYRDSYAKIADFYGSLHGSQCRIASTLSKSLEQLFRQGFCGPQEKSKEGKPESLEDGVGLGEGEGAEDISKDVEDGEDLSDLAQQKSTDDQKHEPQDQDDAVNMNDEDLEGELGSSGEEEHGKSDDGSDGEEDEIDDEVGDVEDKDDFVVDEKLWEGEAEEGKSQKRGDEATGQKQDELAAQESMQGKAEDSLSNEEDEHTAAQEEEEYVVDDGEKMDPHVDESQNLDLPEDIDINGDQKADKDSDDDMDSLSEISGDSSDQLDEENDAEDVEMEDAPQEMASEQGNNLMDEDTIDMAEQAEPNTEAQPENKQDNDRLLQEPRMRGGEMDEPVTKDAEGAGLRYENNEDVKNGGAKGEDGKANDGNGNERNSGQAEGDPDKNAERTNGAQGPQGLAEDERNDRPFQKLGEALERWHRVNKIREVSQSEQQADDDRPLNNGPNLEFEHLPDEEASADAQALGVSHEQTKGLDQKGLDAEANEQAQDFSPESEPKPEDNIIDMEDIIHSWSAYNYQSDQVAAGTVIGSTTDGTKKPSYQQVEIEPDMDEIDSSLSTVRLENQGSLARSFDEARELWTHYESLTREFSLYLTEQLRLILAPTLVTKMRGDFRTGKRLNMKRIIPYIASQFKRDKIWMRRSVPSKRNYQIMLAVDDSGSMGESGSGRLAFETLAMVSRSLSMLEVGEISIVCFGEDVKVAHPFDQPFTSEAGVRVFQHFGFQQTRTNVHKLISESLVLFREARLKQAAAGTELWQLQLIISDGVCEDHESIRRLVRQAHEERVMIVFAIVDALKEESITNMTQATFEPDSSGVAKLKIKRYLDEFPFGYYLIVRNVKDLPNVLAAALRQWFAEVVDAA